MGRGWRIGIGMGFGAMMVLWGCRPSSGPPQDLVHPADRQAVALMVDGMDRFFQGDFQGAERQFTKALEKNPDNGCGYFYRGMTLVRLGRFREAAEDFAHAQALQIREPWETFASLMRGECLCRVGDWEGAWEVFSEKIRQRPEAYSLYEARGRLLLEKQLYAEAQEDFTQVIRANPQHVPAYLQRGLARMQLGELELALEDASRAIGLASESAEAFHLRGQIFFQMKKLESAIRDLSMAIRLRIREGASYNPLLADSYYHRGLVYQALGDFSKAAADFQAAVGCNPEHTQALSAQSALRAWMDSGAQGAQAARRANTGSEQEKSPLVSEKSASAEKLPFAEKAGTGPEERAVPSRPSASVDKGSFVSEKSSPPVGRAPGSERTLIKKYSQMKKHSNNGEASSETKSFGEKQDARPDGRASSENSVGAAKPAESKLAGSASSDASFPQDSLPAVPENGNPLLTKTLLQLTDQLRLEPENAQLWNRRGLVYFQVGMFAEAVGDFTEALGRKPDYPEARSNRAVALERLGQLDQAIADWTEILRRNPQSAQALYHRGRLYAARGKYQEALADLTEACRLQPGWILPRCERAATLVRMERFEEARVAYDEAIRFGPPTARAFRGRGELHLKMGKLPEAIADFSEAIRLEPHNPDNYRGRAAAYLAQGDLVRAGSDLAEAKRLQAVSPASGVAEPTFSQPSSPASNRATP